MTSPWWATDHGPRTAVHVVHWSESDPTVQCVHIILIVSQVAVIGLHITSHKVLYYTNTNMKMNDNDNEMTMK